MTHFVSDLYHTACGKRTARVRRYTRRADGTTKITCVACLYAIIGRVRADCDAAQDKAAEAIAARAMAEDERDSVAATVDAQGALLAQVTARAEAAEAKRDEMASLVGELAAYRDAFNGISVEQARRERRERIATEVLGHTLSDPHIMPYTARTAADTAVEWADALIARLDAAEAPADDDAPANEDAPTAEAPACECRYNCRAKNRWACPCRPDERCPACPSCGTKAKAGA